MAVSIQYDTTTTHGKLYTPASVASTASSFTVSDSSYDIADSSYYSYGCIPKSLPVGYTFNLPDGSKLVLDDDGNYRIEDKDAKVTYLANRFREFSPYLNASDMLAKFVEYAGSLGVKQTEVLGLPIELFINWLIIEAAERDHDPVPAEVVPVHKHRRWRELVKPRCIQCGKFIPRRHSPRFPFCGVEHAGRFLANQRMLTRSLP